MKNLRYFIVKMTGWNGVRPSGNIERERWAECLVRVFDREEGLALFRMMVVHKLGRSGSELLKHLDVGISAFPLEEHIPKGMNLEDMNFLDWLHFIPKSDDAEEVPLNLDYQITEMVWKDRDLYIEAEDGTAMHFTQAIMSHLGIKFENKGCQQELVLNLKFLRNRRPLVNLGDIAREVR